MPQYELHQTPVHFPYDAYECQLNYMESVIKALKNRQNALLESPTGTGKTLSLLCAALAFRFASCDRVSERNSSDASTSARNEVDAALPTGRQDAASKRIEAASDNAGRQPGGGAPGSRRKAQSALPLRIIYASRTHSQLRQVIKELKSTAYVSSPAFLGDSPPVRSTVLAGRDHLCIHRCSETLRGQALVGACQALRKSAKCHFHGGMKGVRKNIFDVPRDVDELRAFARDPDNTLSPFCPFFAAHENQTLCEIVFLPYNYLFNASMRRALQLDLQDAILVVDEAHNCEAVAEDASSFELDISLISMAQRDIKAAMESSHIQEGDEEMLQTARDLCQMFVPLEKLSQFIDTRALDCKGAGTLSATEYSILDEREVKGLLKDFVSLGSEVLRKLADVVTESLGLESVQRARTGAERSRGEGDNKQRLPTGNAFDTLCRVLDCALSTAGNGSMRAGSVYVIHQEGAANRVLSHWNFTADRAIADIMAEGARSLLITSGTLSPLSTLESSLAGSMRKIRFDVQLENTHTISAEQVLCCALTKARKGAPTMTLTYQNRGDTAMIDDLGQTLSKIAAVTPGGVLAFFPSYAAMNAMLTRWQKSNVWYSLLQHKHLFIEPNSGFDGKQQLFWPSSNNPGLRFNCPRGSTSDQRSEGLTRLFKTCCLTAPTIPPSGGGRKGSGALFFAVYRGKMSEGIDFSDHLCRAVCLCGIPYPAVDLKTTLRRQFLDQQAQELAREGLKTITGQEWYNAQAIRATNQAVGRVIRHRNDFGAILLLDARFARRDVSESLPLWVRGSSRVVEDTDDLQELLQNFFAGIPRHYLDAYESRRAKESGATACRTETSRPQCTSFCFEAPRYTMEDAKKPAPASAAGSKLVGLNRLASSTQKADRIPRAQQGKLLGKKRKDAPGSPSGQLNV